MKVTDITIDRIQTYKKFSEEALQAELKELNRLIEIEPQNALLYSARSRVKMHLGLEYQSDMVKRFTLDKEFIDVASQINAELLGASYSYEKSKLQGLVAKLQISEDKKNQLLKDFDIAKITENNLDECLEQCAILFNERDYLNLEKILKLLMDKFPQNSKVFFNYASMLVKVKKLEEALTYYKKTETLEPPLKEVMIHIAGTLYDLGRYREAYDYLAKKSNKEIPDLEHQVKCLIKLEEYEKAKSLYQEIISIDSNYELPNNLLKLHLRPDLLEDEKALRTAAYNGDYSEFKRLTDKGVSVNNQGDKTDRSPLMWLFIGKEKEQARLEILEIIITKKGKNYSDTDGNTAFHHIFLSGNFKLFKSLPNEIFDSKMLFVRNEKKEAPLDILNRKLLAAEKTLFSDHNTVDATPTIMNQYVKEYELLKECRLKIDEIITPSSSILTP